MPEGIAAENVRASFDNGVLEVIVPLPKPSSAGGHEIPITAKRQAGVTH